MLHVYTRGSGPKGNEKETEWMSVDNTHKTAVSVW